MNGLKSIALLALFVGNALLTQAQDQKGDGVYYSEDQRQHINHMLVNAKATDNPVAKKSTMPLDTASVLFLGDYQTMPDEDLTVSDLQKRCDEKCATHIGYNRDSASYSIAIDDLVDLEKNYDSLHRLLKLSYKTSMIVQTYGPRLLLTSTSTDTTESIFITNLLTLEDFSKEAFQPVQGHETGHSLFEYRNQKNPARARRERKSPGAMEYDCDSVATALYGQARIDSQLKIAGVFNKYMQEYKNPEKTLLKYTYRFDKDLDFIHPPMGSRLQYEYAILQYTENKDQDGVKPPSYPVRIKNWEPTP